MNSAHLATLEAKHALLDARITAETNRPLPDALMIGQLKKRKLRLKEEMVAR